MSLKEYRRKRKFDQTPEPPPGKRGAKTGALRFVIQKHAATRMHYDFRLEFDGSLKSWAVPKGPSLTSQDPRLAVKVEDHPLAYGEFEGVIPKGNYGAGTVMIWDAGTFIERGSHGRNDSDKALQAGLAKGHLTFILSGSKLRGEFALVKIKKKGAEENVWLLIKKHDAEASRRDVLLEDKSTLTGRSMKEIAATAEGRGEVWIPGKGRRTTPPKATPAKAPPRKTQQAGMPRRVRPMEPVFATTKSEPKAKEWIFETFGTGTRAMAEVEPSRSKLYSRAFLPFERKYPVIVQALNKLGYAAVFDGELSDGSFIVSDVLYHEGKDLRELPLKERKKILSSLSLQKPLKAAEFSQAVDDVVRSPNTMVVAKKSDSRYRSGITKDWQRFRISTSPKTKATLEKPPLTHPDKLFFPDDGITKGDLAEYYESVADILLPHLIDRPQSLHRQPDGIRNDGFFHKDMNSFLPRRIKTERVVSSSSGKTINYVLCQDRWSLLYLVNLGCIELNPWLSKKPHLDRPDMIVIDLDPDDNPFSEVIKVAREVLRVLKAVGAESYCKTSGATGLHICIPTGAKYDYDTGRDFAEAVCQIVGKKFPKTTSMERSPAKRKGQIYLDYLQNRRSQTLAAAYCVRPRPKATVSTPLKWSEVKTGLRPEAFTIKTMARRLEKVGDLWKPMLTAAVDIEACMKQLLKRFHS